MTTKLKEKRGRLDAINKELNGIKNVADKFNTLKTQLDLKTREVGIVEERLKQSTHHLKVSAQPGFAMYYCPGVVCLPFVILSRPKGRSRLQITSNGRHFFTQPPPPP